MVGKELLIPKWVRVFLLLLLVSSPVRAFAQAAKLPVTVPLYQSSRGHCLVRLRVNGQKPLLFVFDTGAYLPLTVEPWAAKTLHLTPVSPAAAKTVEGIRLEAAPLQTVAAVGINGEIALPLKTAYILPRPLFAEPYNGEPIAGIVGVHLLQNAVVTLDFSRSEMRFLPAVPAPLGKEAAALKLHKAAGKDGRLFLAACVEPGAPFYALIDTGAELTLFNAVRINDAPDTYLSVRHIPAYMGISQTFYPFDEARVKTLRLGDGQTVTEPNVAVVLDAPGAKPFGGDLLGLKFLRRFVLTFDYNHDTIYVRRASDYQKQTRSPGWIGATIRAAPAKASNGTPDENAGFPAFDTVLPNSPAYRAGIKPGDFLVSIDGKSAEISAEVTEVTLDRMERWLDGAEGTPVRLVVRSANANERTLTLVRVSPFKQGATRKR